MRLAEGGDGNRVRELPGTDISFRTLRLLGTTHRFIVRVPACPHRFIGGLKGLIPLLSFAPSGTDFCGIRARACRSMLLHIPRL